MIFTRARFDREVAAATRKTREQIRDNFGWDVVSPQWDEKLELELERARETLRLAKTEIDAALKKADELISGQIYCVKHPTWRR